MFMELIWCESLRPRRGRMHLLHVLAINIRILRIPNTSKYSQSLAQFNLHPLTPCLPQLICNNPDEKLTENKNTPTLFGMCTCCVIQCAKITSVHYPIKLHQFQDLHVLSLAHFNHVHSGLQVLAHGDGWLGGEAEILHREANQVAQGHPDGFRECAVDAKPQIGTGSMRYSPHQTGLLRS